MLDWARAVNRVLAPASTGTPVAADWTARATAAAGHAAPGATNMPRPRRRGDRALAAAALALATLITTWLVVILAAEHGRFVVVTDPSVQVGVESASALARLFSALVLILFPAGGVAQRLRWVAAGLIVQGSGGLLFGYLAPLFDPHFDLGNLNLSLYASLVISTGAGTLFVVGLVPATPPRLSGQAILLTFVVFALASLGVVVGASHLPPMVQVTSIQAALQTDSTVFPGLTTWHWALAIIPLGLAIAAAAGTLCRRDRDMPDDWLVMAMVLFAGSQLHQMFWPSAYMPVLTTATPLRLLFALVVAVGGLIALRRIAAQRAALLAAEREYSRRLGELAVLKADFTAMVAHELGSPIATIANLAEMLATDGLSPGDRAQALAAVRAEATILHTLVADMRAAAAMERDDFDLRVRAIPVGTLLDAATTFARTLRGGHPFRIITDVADGRVWADPERITQVLRNLLGNAAKYSPDGAPIELRVSRHGSRVRFEVADQGSGIPPDDIVRIFEKFARGRDPRGQKIPGIGLGLYLSRRIIQAHGADLTVVSTPGQGSVFAFELEASR